MINQCSLRIIEIIKPVRFRNIFSNYALDFKEFRNMNISFIGVATLELIISSINMNTIFEMYNFSSRCRFCLYGGSCTVLFTFIYCCEEDNEQITWFYRLSDLFSLNHLIAWQSIDSATEFFHMVGNLWFLKMFPPKFGLLKVYELIA